MWTPPKAKNYLRHWVTVFFTLGDFLFGHQSDQSFGKSIRSVFFHYLLFPLRSVQFCKQSAGSLRRNAFVGMVLDNADP
jgi:hypothetical protein